MRVVYVVLKVFEVLGYLFGLGLVAFAAWYVVDEFWNVPAHQRAWAGFARSRQSLHQSARPAAHAAVRTRPGLLFRLWVRVVRFLQRHLARPGRS